MKQKDIMLIAVVTIISAVISLVISNALFNSPKHRNTQVEVVEKLNDSFHDPSTKYFNDKSINPTKTINIGDNPNTDPFQ